MSWIGQEWWENLDGLNIYWEVCNLDLYGRSQTCMQHVLDALGKKTIYIFGGQGRVIMWPVEMTPILNHVAVSAVEECGQAFITTSDKALQWLFLLKTFNNMQCFIY